MCELKDPQCTGFAKRDFATILLSGLNYKFEVQNPSGTNDYKGFCGRRKRVGCLKIRLFLFAFFVLMVFCFFKSQFSEEAVSSQLPLKSGVEHIHEYKKSRHYTQ